MLCFRRPQGTGRGSHANATILLVQEGLDVPPYSETDPYPSFRMDTYAALSNEQARAAGDSILQHINDFLATFTADEQRDVFLYFCQAKHLIAKIGYENNSVRSVTDTITHMTFQLMMKYHLPERSVDHTKKTVQLLDLDYVGKEAHYSDKFSFYAPDYYDLTAISLLCKFMCPIWGEFISRIKQTRTEFSAQKDAVIIDERNNKELFCATMIIPVLEQETFRPIYLKLYGYMKNIIAQSIRAVESTSSPSQPEVDFVTSRYGYEIKRFEDFVYAIILVKRIVGFDPWQIKANGDRANIATHINVAMAKTATQQIIRMRNETRTMTRNEISDSASDDPDNISLLDNMSKISTVTADIPIAVMVGVMAALPRRLQALDIPPAIFEKAVDYYAYVTTEPTIFNLALMAALNSDWLGGSPLIKYLDYAIYLRLLTYTQIYLLKHNYPQLALFMSCKTELDQLDAIRPEGQRIRNNIKNTSEFRRVLETYPGHAEKPIAPRGPTWMTRNKKEIVETVNIAGQIDRLQNWVIDHDHSLQFAPILHSYVTGDWCDRLDNELPLYYNEKIVQEICHFFLARSDATRNAI